MGGETVFDLVLTARFCNYDSDAYSSRDAGSHFKFTSPVGNITAAPRATERSINSAHNRQYKTTPGRVVLLSTGGLNL